MSTIRLDGFSFTTPSVCILRKKTDTLMFPLRDDFTVTDLSLTFPDKVGYLSTHYTTTPFFKLNSMKKVLIIAASPHGYGHLYRGEIISHYLAQNGFSVTLLSSNPEPLTQSEGIPYATCTIDMDPGPDGERARRQLLEHIGKVRFDLVLIDHFPLGKLFFMDAFKVLYEKLHRHVRFFCVFRDIFSIDDFRQRIASIEVLNQYFDRLLVFSDPKLLMLPDILTQGIRIPIDYLGYLNPDGEIPQITVFGGGGKFNLPFYRQTLKVIHRMDMDRSFRVKLFTGRILPETQRKELEQEFPSISISDHSIELMQEISRSCITISTFGYNTLVQLLHVNNYNILVPLPKNFQEQYTRAELFVQRKEKASIVILDPMYQELLAQRLEDIKGRLINLGGLPALAMKLQTL
jgi:predicted glycosyltransferase